MGSHARRNLRSRLGRLALVTPFIAAALFIPVLLAAQQQGQGPMPSGPAPTDSPIIPPRPAGPPPGPPNQTPPPSQGPARVSSGISQDQPSLPVDEIIQKFAQHEAEFKTERDNFTYTQSFIVQTIDNDGQPDGEYQMTSDITFTPAGKRYENITYAPPPTLERVQLSQEDLDDVRNIQPFVLTTDDIPKYDVKYVGRERLDEVGTYVFDVGPKKIEKNQRYFQGRVWVDDRDLEIVKTNGKAVPDIHKGGSENVFPTFTTYRENIEGHYWFPTYTHADDYLHFANETVHIRMTIKYTDYKRFRVSSRVMPKVEAAPPQK